VGLIGVSIGPMVATLLISFTKYNLLSPPRWIGLQNYVDLFTDPIYLKSIQVTLIYVFVSVPLKLAFALLLALILNRALAAVGIYRAVYYVPSLLGASVAIAIVWRQLFGAEGAVNALLALAGWRNPPDWVADPHYALYTLILLAVWEFGSPMIIFLAGLKQIPAEFYEAASIDGAGRMRQFVRITLPLLTPLVLFNLVLQAIGAFQAFTPSYVVSGGTGGPVNSTMFYTLYLYQQAFGQLNFGYGSAMAWLLLIATALVTGGIFFSSRYWVFYQDRTG
jgi:multiple sugar transport system permease protein